MSDTPRPRMTPMRATYEGLRVERHQPTPTRIKEDPQLADLREVIHILAMALTDGKATS